MLWILLVILVAFALATFECPKRINFTVQEANSCCSIQKPKWDSLPIKCSKYMTMLKKPVSPCAYECIFNVTHILQNGRIEVPYIRPILRKVYTEEVSQEAYITAFEKCATIFNKIISEQSEHTKSTPRSSSSRKSPTSKQCSPIPLKLVMCASREIFINCPPIHWTATSTCKYIREYSINCDATLSLQRKNIRSHSRG